MCGSIPFNLQAKGGILLKDSGINDAKNLVASPAASGEDGGQELFLFPKDITGKIDRKGVLDRKLLVELLHGKFQIAIH
jgi:hypothetical protein